MPPGVGYGPMAVGGGMSPELLSRLGNALSFNVGYRGPNFEAGVGHDPTRAALMRLLGGEQTDMPEDKGYGAPTSGSKGSGGFDPKPFLGAMALLPGLARSAGQVMAPGGLMNLLASRMR